MKTRGSVQDGCFRWRGGAGVVVVMSLSTVIGCRAIDLRAPLETSHYDANEYGTHKEDILEHFNLHRGRWWNYYLRGSCLLAYGHYDAARADFNEAIARRSEDQRDARTYGMHFIDYFPNRERAIAVYLERITTKDPDAEKDLLSFGRAVAGLERSLNREESSRAKFYWNRARREVLRRTTKDSNGPRISVKSPIYTPRRTVWFDVTAKDEESGVAEIRISGPYGNLAITQPKFLIELAEEEVTRTVEVTLTPGRPMAVVEITASDLVGNTSPPTEVLIMLDTKSPQEPLTAGEDAGRGRWMQASWSPSFWKLPPRYDVAAQNWDGSALSALASVSGAHLYLGSIFTTRGVGLWTSSLVHAQELAVGTTRGPEVPTFDSLPRGYEEPGVSEILERVRNDPGSVYQILWLLFFSEYSWDVPTGPDANDPRRKVYRTVYEKLGGLRIRTEAGEEWPARFGVHDVETVYGQPLDKVWNRRVDGVVDDLLDWQSGKPPAEPVGPTHVNLNPIDLVVYGELGIRLEGGEEIFELTLRVRDLPSQEDLAFSRMEPPLPRMGPLFPTKESRDKTKVLADIQGTWEDRESWIKELSSKVSKRIPWLPADVSFARSPWYSLRRSEVRIDVGENDRAFEGMKLHFYTNGGQKRICAGEIVRVRADFSVVKPEGEHELPKNGVIAVTK